MAARALLFTLVAIIFQIQANTGRVNITELEIAIATTLEDIKVNFDRMEALLAFTQKPDIPRAQINLAADDKSCNIPGKDECENITDLKTTIVNSLADLKGKSVQIERYLAIESLERRFPVARKYYDIQKINAAVDIPQLENIIAHALDHLEVFLEEIVLRVTDSHESDIRFLEDRLTAFRTYYDAVIKEGNCPREYTERCYKLTNAILEKTEKEQKNNIDRYHGIVAKYSDATFASITKEHSKVQKVYELSLNDPFRECIGISNRDDCAVMKFNDIRAGIPLWKRRMEEEARHYNKQVNQKLNSTDLDVDASLNEMEEDFQRYQSAVLTCASCYDSDELHALESSLGII
ncbi:uncharacterized protein LOC135171002 isoform X2 [Diachasmimorpha longicaudata]|uniref:uncharacterized protein LOC135171002 isoform X2 n=1 Tax=Diachasmimorpha longicaudata TaxID=58733 RepID=UPI0030B8ED74